MLQRGNTKYFDNDLYYSIIMILGERLVTNYGETGLHHERGRQVKFYPYKKRGEKKF